MDVFPVGIAALNQALGQGDLSAVDATKHYLAQIEARDGELNSFITVTADLAMKQAEASDKRRQRGEAIGPLDGIPIALKDNIDVAGVLTTNGLAADWASTAERDAVVVEKLKAAGTVVLGKTNMHEAALGATTNNPHFGTCHNPLRHGYTPGGSSGGSGVAVAAGLCAAALGTDTLGSVRIPAAYCGCFGFKPTTGLVSNRGVTPLSWTLDHVGPLTPCAEDMPIIMQVMAQYDAECPNARQKPRSLPTLSSRRIGVIADLAERAQIETGVERALQTALEQLQALGVKRVDVSLPKYDFTQMRRAGLLITEAEGAVVHAEGIANHPTAYSDELRKMLAWGARQSAQKLARAYHDIRAVAVMARHLFTQVDLLVLPTAPQTAFSFNDLVPTNQAGLTGFANLARLPAITIPISHKDQDLPVGLQLIGPEFQDAFVMQAAIDLVNISK